ncbi:hypothetical protein D3C78_582220 [compost metagenome]
MQFGHADIEYTGRLLVLLKADRAALIGLEQHAAQGFDLLDSAGGVDQLQRLGHVIDGVGTVDGCLYDGVAHGVVADDAGLGGLLPCVLGLPCGRGLRGGGLLAATDDVVGGGIPGAASVLSVLFDLLDEAIAHGVERTAGIRD